MGRSVARATAGLALDAYEPVCRRLSRLCPRLVPEPLWGVSLASLARCDASIISRVFGVEESALREFSSWWFRLDRSRCSVCGSRGSHIDEVWLYEPGVARLVSLQPLCEKCHLAKHIGFASVRGAYREALEHLARVNGVDVETVEELVGLAFEIHARLSEVRRWRISVEVDIPHVRLVESVLNAMASSSMSVQEGMLVKRGLFDARERLEKLSRLLSSVYGCRGLECIEALCRDPRLYARLAGGLVDEATVSRVACRALDGLVEFVRFEFRLESLEQAVDAARLIRRLDTGALTIGVSCSGSPRLVVLVPLLPLPEDVQVMSEVLYAVGVTP